MAEPKTRYFEEEEDFSRTNVGRLSSDFILSFDEVTHGKKV